MPKESNHYPFQWQTLEPWFWTIKKKQSPVDDGVAFRATCHLNWWYIQVRTTFSWGLLVTKGNSWVYSLTGRKGSPSLLLLPRASFPSTSHVYVLWTYFYFVTPILYLCSGNGFTGWWGELCG